MLDVNCIEKTAELQQRYGVDWCQKLLAHWGKSDDMHYYRSQVTLDNLEQLIKKAVRKKLDETLIIWLFNYQLQQMIKQDELMATSTPIGQRNSAKKRVEVSIELLRAYCVLKAANTIAQKWIEHIKSQSSLYSVPDVADIYFSLINDIPISHQPVLAILDQYVKESISEELGRGLREVDDWSIHVKLNCSCVLCKTTVAFLSSQTESKKIWPIAQGSRSHVTDMLRNHGVPVDLHVLKQGSPHKLVLTKTGQLYLTAKKRHEKLTAYSKAACPS